jgi:FAD/FMN-containing dehydrogenase
VSPLASALGEIVGTDHVLTDPDVTASYATDWTGRFRGDALLVVRPGDAQQVAAVVARCAEAGAAVVPQGGNTGLVGGGVPRRRAMVVLSTRRLDRVEPVDAAAMQVSLGAGVTLAGWRRHARAAGLDAPVDFASRDSATVGGAVATNAGGSRVVRFGPMRSQVAGATAALADGSEIGSLSGLPKETAGLHWPSLLCGSEGTLAVLTAVRLRLVPWYRHTATALLATAGLDEAVAVLARLRAGVPHLDAVELILPEAMALVAEHLGSAPPIGGEDRPVAAYVMVECADHADPTEELTAALAESAEVLDAAVTTEGPARDRLVAFRDRIAEAIAARGVPLKLDVAVPVGALGELLANARRAVARHGGHLVPFGHLAEGNVHLNVLDPGDPEAITADVLTAAAERGGTISAEHGVGVAKADWLHLIRSPAELDAARRIKSALDPVGTLNPGVLGLP